MPAVDHNKPLYGSINSLERALKSGSDVNARNVSGWTMLHHAASIGNARMVRLLLDHGADPNTTATYQQTPLHILFDSFLKTKTRSNAVENTCLEIACLLIESGANVEAMDYKYHEPIGYLISNGSGKLCRAILQEPRVKKGIRLTIRKTLDAFLWTGITLGVIGDIQHCLDAGADVNARNHLGQTPLHKAAMNGYIDLARALLDSRAEVNARFPVNGFTPLHYASVKGYPEITALCLDHGANANARDNNSETPFHHACRWNFPAIARLLLERGANLTARTSNGYTGLDLLLAGEQKDPTGEIVALFRERAPDLVFSAFCTMDLGPGGL